MLEEQILKALQLRDEEPERSVEEVAAALAEAIDEYVKSGDVVDVSTNVTVSVTTSGSPTAQTGTGTGTGTQAGTGKIR
jgi:DNA-binding transcriptional regulator LsrR (DeoR family)